MPTPAIAFPVPVLSGLADDRPWLLLDAAGGAEGMHGFLIAGVRRRMDLHHPDESAYDRITKFIGAASGRCFGWIGYDQLRAHSLLDLPDQPEVTVPLPVAHWVEPEGVLAFQGTGSDAQLDWLVSPEPHLAKRMERAIRTVHPVADTAGGPAVSGKSALDAERYRTAFDRVRGHILRGDVYELNLCREIHGNLPQGWCPNVAFGTLTSRTSAPFSARLHWDGVDILCASPERFLRREGDRLISQPIKGTAPRDSDPKRDAAIAEALRTDPKERAENVMITDLVRNDLSQVALPATVEVEELCGIHSFRNVHQMISTVTCTIRPECGFSDILRAAFPMGSMTGAPKIRAMEITAEVEPVRRGLYSGAIGWADPDGQGGVGDFDLNVVIRTALVDREAGRWSIHVGGAITAMANAAAEWEETRLKARAVLRALNAVESESTTLGPDAG
ncbi:MAG: aminodeoxychorismate synthase component I [Flavobacteriales bacterium]|nr:aminodeoxychorismate synthase component I [Flavobacteriales bacterium]